MSIQIQTPALGESISEATISKIYKKSGDFVNKDELIAEIETEKVVLEVCATTSGKISNFSAQEGQTVKTGDVICIIEGVSGNTKIADQEKEVDKSIEKKQQNEQIKPLPAAQRVIYESNISENTSKIEGSGKKGQILKEDVLSYLNNLQSEELISNESNKEAISAKNTGNTERVKMSKLRQTIAKRLKHSQNTAAILTTFNEIDMKEVIALRNEYKEKFEKKYSIKLGFMSFFTKAVVTALKEIPVINAEIDGNEIIYKNYYNIGVAVGTEQGLVVPVIKNCDTLSLAQIENEISNFGKKAREGRLAISEMQGGTFTISNGGIYGSLLSTPIINPPESGILGLHNIVQRPIAIKDQVEIHPMMYVALSYDHRIIDGKEAVMFLVKIKELIEDPRRLILEI